MSPRPRSRPNAHPSAVTATAFIVAALLASRCTSDAARAEAGGQCVFNDDCADPLVCAGGRCRVQCRSNRDCPPNHTCNPSDEPTKRVCLPPDARSLCATDLDCPVGTSCLPNSSCWRRCRENSMCSAHQMAAVCITGTGLCSAAVSASEQATEPLNSTLPDGAVGDVPATVDAPSSDVPSSDVPSIDSPVADTPSVDAGAVDDLVDAAPDAAPDAGPAVDDVPEAPDSPADVAPDLPVDVPVDLPSDLPVDTPVDVPPADVACSTGVANCNNDARDLCEVNLAIDPSHCGRCGNVCPAPLNAAARCELGVCGFRCDAGFRLSDDRTSCDIDLPRPVAPMSTATVNTATPTLRWAPIAGQAGVRVEVCRTRLCDAASIVQTADVTTAASHRLTALPRGQYYWRLRGLRSGSVATPPTTPWQIRIAPSARGMVETVAGAAPDPNGDGLADVIIGASAPNNSQAFGGVAQLHLSGTGGVASDPAARWTGSGVGSAVGGAGDVNGDGFGDVFVASTGSISVYAGNPLGVGTSASGTATNAASGFGQGACAAGDLDADGYGDLVVIATYGAPNPSVFVFPGGPRGLSSAGVTLAGPTATGFGISMSVAGAGDIDGNGYPDFVVGYNGERALFVYLTTAAGPASRPTHTISAGSVANFGAAVALADVNGDGYADVIGGGGGTVQVHFGSTTGVSNTPSQTLSGANGSGSLSRAGDINLDGFEDVLFGQPNGQSAVAVMYGSATGLTPGLTVNAPAGFSIRFGQIVSGAGDLDGDGRDDILVGDYDYRAAQVYYGSSLGLRLGELLRAANTAGFGSAIASRWWRRAWRGS